MIFFKKYTVFSHCLVFTLLNKGFYPVPEASLRAAHLFKRKRQVLFLVIYRYQRTITLTANVVNVTLMTAAVRKLDLYLKSCVSEAIHFALDQRKFEKKKKNPGKLEKTSFRKGFALKLTLSVALLAVKSKIAVLLQE